MCTFTNNPKLRKPKEEKIIAYKIFEKKRTSGEPMPTMNLDCFKLGWNKWDTEYDNEQLGFQVFAKLKDAKNYAFSREYICPVTIFTKDIVKITNDFNGTFRVYEVKAFALWKKVWKLAEMKRRV